MEIGKMTPEEIGAGLDMAARQMAQMRQQQLELGKFFRGMDHIFGMALDALTKIASRNINHHHEDPRIVAERAIMDILKYKETNAAIFRTTASA